MTDYQSFQSALVARLPQLLWKENQSLAPYTTFKIGGPCPLLLFPKNQEELVTALTLGKSAKIPLQILGNGSNMLISDQGVQAVFIQTKQWREITPLDCGTKIKASAGCTLPQLSKYALEKGLSGMSFAHGIPGTLGGAVTMNAGAYGGEMSQIVETVTYFSQETGEISTLSKEELDFSYRHSFFSGKNHCILWAELALSPGDPVEIQREMEQFSKQRQEKQPLDFPSAGSTFKRPEGHFAAALIDQCGLKGFSIGDAQVSPKHAGFVVNLGNATATQVLALVDHVTETVLAQTGVNLSLEIELL